PVVETLSVSSRDLSHLSFDPAPTLSVHPLLFSVFGLTRLSSLIFYTTRTAQPPHIHRNGVHGLIGATSLPAVTRYVGWKIRCASSSFTSQKERVDESQVHGSADSWCPGT